MTNPAPDFSAKVKFDSVVEPQHTIGKLSLASTSNQSNESVRSDALLCPEPQLRGSPGMDPAKTPATVATTTTKGLHSIIHKSTTTTTKENKRKISFLVDDKDEIVEEIHQYPFAPLAQEDVWWTDDELDHLLTEAMLVAEYFTTKRKDWQNKIKLVLKGCGGGKCKEGNPIKLKASQIDFVVDCEARGLELYIHPIFQKNREKAIKGVVKVQAEYNASEKKKGKKDPELRLKVLRAQSLKLTQTARLMAKTLADGDRRAATKEEEEEVETTRAGGPPLEEIVTSEELQTPSLELGSQESSDSIGECDTQTEARPPPRPRARSPVRGSFRGSGLKDLQNQNVRILQTNRPGAGGIGSLQVALEELPGDELEC